MSGPRNGGIYLSIAPISPSAPDGRELPRCSEVIRLIESQPIPAKRIAPNRKVHGVMREYFFMNSPLSRQEYYRRILGSFPNGEPLRRDSKKVLSRGRDLSVVGLTRIELASS